MGRPKDGYYIDGERVPGVTTIINRFKPSGGLIHWAWQQGKDGKDYRETRDAAADAGTIAHDMVEADIYGAQFDRSQYNPELLEKADGAFKAYQEWKAQTQLEIAESECSLLSYAHRFGGTIDAVVIRGALAIADWKTASGTFPDHLIQLAAYVLLWEENYPERPITGGAHLLRFSKQATPNDPIAFTHHYWSNLDLAKEQFLLYRRAYDLDKRIAKLL